MKKGGCQKAEIGMPKCKTSSEGETLRIDTGAWDVIDVVVCISCSTPHRLISDTPYEKVKK